MGKLRWAFLSIILWNGRGTTKRGFPEEMDGSIGRSSMWTKAGGRLSGQSSTWGPSCHLTCPPSRLLQTSKDED